ncbi:MAG: ABC transporter substrate-binding protein [Firmicutes bacterium]|nr:ABC transporter substrate-binding protein [Bacillota bacterium]
MSKRLIFLVTAIFLLALASSGCSKPVPPQGGFEKPIKIGLILPMKGELENYGLLCKNAIDLAVDDVNSKGGVLGRKIEIFPGDDSSNENVAASIAAQFAQVQKVSAIVGPYTNQSAISAGPYANRLGVPMIAIRASEPNITQIGSYVFRACYVDKYQGTVLARFTERDLKLKKAAAIYNSGDPGAKDLIDNFKQEFEKLGGKVESVQVYDINATDFTAQVNEVAKTSPEVILLPDFEDKAGLIMKQVAEKGIKCTFLGTDLWNGENLLKIAGDVAVGSYFTAHFSPEDPDARVQEFVDLYQSDYGNKPGPSAALSYDAISLVIEAIKRANSDDPKKIRDALATIRGFKGVTGTFSFDEERNPKKGGTILKLEKDAQVFVKRIDP